MASNETKPDTKPCQVGSYSRFKSGRIPTAVHMKAYEVYKACYGEQQALLEGDCRGGFGVNEIVVFLYAANFPRSEWRAIVNVAFEGTDLM